MESRSDTQTQTRQTQTRRGDSERSHDSRVHLALLLHIDRQRSDDATLAGAASLAENFWRGVSRRCVVTKNRQQM
jgi:hypothetical protein